MLALFSPDLACEVVTDASKHSIGGVLLQDGHAIAFESRLMNGAEQRYGVGEQELLATVHCLKKWRCYLEGGEPFVVVTDHNPNVFLNTKSSLTRRQSRWSELLQSFPFQWNYRPGKTNLADSLTRLDSRSPSTTATHAVVSIRHKNSEGISNGSTMEDCYGKSTLMHLHVGFTDNVDDIEKIIREGYASGFEGFRGLNQEIYGLRENNSIWFKDDKVFVPGGARRKIMELGHADPIAGHFGIKKSTEYIGRQYWWPTMLTYITNFVCLVCQRSKPSQSRPGGLLQPLPIPERRWSSVSMDFITGLPLTIRGKNMYTSFCGSVFQNGPLRTRCRNSNGEGFR